MNRNTVTSSRMKKQHIPHSSYDLKCQKRFHEKMVILATDF